MSTRPPRGGKPTGRPPSSSSTSDAKQRGNRGRGKATARPEAKSGAGTGAGASSGARAGSRTGAGAGPERPAQSSGREGASQPRNAATASRAGARAGAGAAHKGPDKAPHKGAHKVVAAEVPSYPHEPDYLSWSPNTLEAVEAAGAEPTAAPVAAPAGRPFRTGYVVLSGQPNAGKSTLMNRLVGEKLAIVSPKPQTTRDNIHGILTTADTQLVFLDTPGIHKARSPLNRAMVGQAIEALESVDVVVLVVDCVKAAQYLTKYEKWLARHPHKPDAEAAELQHDDEGAEDETAGETESDAAQRPEGDDKASAKGFVPIDLAIHPGDRRVIRNILRHNNNWLVALNKIDRIKKPQLLPILQAYSQAPGVGGIVPISAWTADGLRPLLEAIRAYLPEAEPEFAADELTDRSLKFLCAELVREQVFLQTRAEVPYGVACEIEVFEELADLTHIQALVHVEKPAQRAILIGKGGARMKALGTAARQQMERLLGRKVFLEIHVRIEQDWASRLEKLKEFGYLA